MREVPQILANPLVDLHTPRPACATARICDAPAPLRLWHLTSLDAPTVAVLWTLAFASAARVALPLWVPVLLALTAWSVYIGDRLLDAFSALRSSRHGRLRLRHRFHWRHRRVFLPVGLLAACAAAVLVFSLMPVAARERNSLLAAAALVYFTRVHSPLPIRTGLRLRVPILSPSALLSKEMLVGLLFTAACVLPTLTRIQPSTSTLGPFAVAALFFALLAWLNCHAIEHWESRHPSSSPAILAPALLLSLLGLLASSLLAFTHPRPASLLLAGAISALLLGLLDRSRHRLTPLALRICADLALLTPLPLLFLAP